MSDESVLYVAGSCEPEEIQTDRGPGYFYLGRDEGGQELEVIIVDVTENGVDSWLVIHAMPTSLNKGKTAKKLRKRGGRK